MNELEYIGVGIIYKFVDKNTNGLMVVKFDKESRSIVSEDFGTIPKISEKDWEKIKKPLKNMKLRTIKKLMILRICKMNLAQAKMNI